jgi:membrane protein
MWKGFKTTGLLFKEAFQGWSEDNIPRLGASIAYYTVFSLAPLLIITIAIAGLAFGEQATQGKVVHEFSGLLGATGAQAVEAMIRNAYHPKSGLIATGLGLTALFVGATGVFVEIQSALNFIWAVKPLPGRTIRTLVRQRFLSAAMIMGISFMLLVSLVISTALTAIGTFLSDSLPGGAQVWVALNFLISLTVNSFLFGLIFKFLPDVKIAWRDVT